MNTEFTPYYAVIFTSIVNDVAPGYSEMADYMEELAKLQPGYLSFESARGELGISISYWKTLEDIKNWKQQSEHLMAQKFGRERWYKYYKTRVCRVEREYEFNVE